MIKHTARLFLVIVSWFFLGLPSRSFTAELPKATQAMLKSGKHSMELRDEVCSPSGAAIYGIHVLDKADDQSGVAAAVEAAHKRAHEFAKSDNPQ